MNKAFLVFLLGIVSNLLVAQTSEHLVGSWKLVKEKRLYKSDKNLPSIMAVPEDEQSTGESQPRTAQLHLSSNYTLQSIDNGLEQTTTFNLDGTKLTLGNREYLLNKVTKRKLIFIEEGLFGDTKIVFKRM